jgi:hypothetical protein
VVGLHQLMKSQLDIYISNYNTDKQMTKNLHTLASLTKIKNPSQK